MTTDRLAADFDNLPWSCPLGCGLLRMSALDNHLATHGYVKSPVAPQPAEEDNHAPTAPLAAAPDQPDPSAPSGVGPSGLGTPRPSKCLCGRDDADGYGHCFDLDGDYYDNHGPATPRPGIDRLACPGCGATWEVCSTKVADADYWLRTCCARCRHDVRPGGGGDV